MGSFRAGLPTPVRMVKSTQRRSGGIGRRAAFRAQWAKAHVGSNPTFGTTRPPCGAGSRSDLCGARRWGNIADGMVEPSGKTPPIQRLAVVVAIAVALLILGDLNRRMEDARRMERDARALGSQVAALQSRSIALQTQIAAATGEAVVEAWAHSQGKMVLDGEKLIVPVPPPGAPTAAPPTATPVPDAPRPWLVWSELLFGD